MSLPGSRSSAWLARGQGQGIDQVPELAGRDRSKGMSVRLSPIQIALIVGATGHFGCGGKVVYLEGDEGSPEVEEEELRCEGEFGEPEVLFVDEGWLPQALAPTSDGLEFFYARRTNDVALDESGQRHVTVRRRASLDEPLGEPIQVAELMFACDALFPGTQLAGLDVSPDALRLYIACNAFRSGPDSDGQLIIATRPDRLSPFEVQSMPIGMVGTSIGLTRDELTAYATSLDPERDGIWRYQRADVNEAFGDGVLVEGLSEVMNPEPIPDGLGLLMVDKSGSPRRMVASYRSTASDPLALPSSAGLPQPPAGSSDYSPALSADCATLYFTRVGGGDRVMVARREFVEKQSSGALEGSQSD